MNKSSWMMAGSKMEIETDLDSGRKIGSEIILKGKMMGVSLFVKERICSRNPPYSKSWETVGPQKMIILDQYRMGFEITPDGSKTKLRVFIDYSIPSSGVSHILGKISAHFYAKWCTEMMVRDAKDAFKKGQTKESEDQLSSI